jgi:hypothetical protein
MVSMPRYITPFKVQVGGCVLGLLVHATLLVG